MTNETQRSCLTIVLAAGEGTRMKSDLPKVLHKVAGLEMVNHVVASAMQAGDSEDDLCVVITGNNRDLVEASVGARFGDVMFFEQYERLGTANAVMAAENSLLYGFDDVLVLFGDTPLLQPQTLLDMRQCLTKSADVAVLGFRTSQPDGYGRLLEENGKLIAIREHKEASAKEREINFCNGGIMAINGKKCLELVSSISNKNQKGEFYLTDVVEIAHANGLQVVAHEGDSSEILGINTRVELAQAEGLWQARQRREMMLAGVTMQAPDTVFLSHDTRIGAQTILEPNQFFATGVTIGKSNTIRANCHFDTCVIQDHCDIGPYARLRPGTKLANRAKVGNFVEIKKADIGEGAKVNHLSYIGDAIVGPKANIGAGTITCNYDGVNKHVTQIGAGAFIGSNSALVAPVKIGDNAYVGSGSVITKDAPDDSLVVSRARQVTIEDKAKTLKLRALRFKAQREKE